MSAGLTNLERLHLDGNPIDDAGIEPVKGDQYEVDCSFAGTVIAIVNVEQLLESTT